MNKDIETVDKVFKIKNRYELYKNLYCWLYPFTTENIKGYIEKLDIKDKNILTTTSSGDHILNSYLMGAKSVDGFDINPLAKYYSELKIASIKELTLEEFLSFLYNKNPYFLPKKYLNEDTYYRVSKHLDEKTQNFWNYVFNKYSKNKIEKSHLFTRDFLNRKALLKSNLYLNKDNYIRLRHILDTKRSNYYDLDISDINKLDNNYDIIMLSNIPACYYIENEKQKLIELKGLLYSLRNNPTIILSYLYCNLFNHIDTPLVYNEILSEGLFNKEDKKAFRFESTTFLEHPIYKIFNFIPDVKEMSEDYVIVLKKTC